MIDTYGLNTLGPVYLPDPVNRAHPLNHGRLAWWLTVPCLDGGQFWHDLTGLNPGTLSNMTTTASGWRGTTRPGGYGHLQFDGVDDLVVTNQAYTPSNNQITVACWFRPDVLTRGDLVTCWTGGAANSQFDLLYGLTSGKPQFYVSSGSGNNSSGASPLVMTVGNWYRIVGTYDGSLAKIFVNGQFQSSSLATGIALNTAALTAVRIGNNANLDGKTTGAIDDVSIWNRCLAAVPRSTDSEIQADYDLSRLGYPGVLNRMSSRFYSLSAAGSLTRRAILAAYNPTSYVTD